MYSPTQQQQNAIQHYIALQVKIDLQEQLQTLESIFHKEIK